MLRALILLPAVILSGCSGDGPRPGDPPPHAPLFAWSFRPGYTVSVNEAGKDQPEQRVTIGFQRLALGRLELTSGRITACDPFVGLGDTPAFTQPVPNGAFPVELALISGGESRGRVAFARVVFGPAPPASWRMALTPAQHLTTLKTGEVFGYPVDAGTGAFFDADAGKAAAALLRRDENAWEDWQVAGEENGKRADYQPNFFLMQPMPPGNMAMFASGWGDGYYTSWFGYSADGAVVTLVTDFGIIDQSVATWQPPH